MGKIRNFGLNFYKIGICLVFLTTPLESISISEALSNFSVVKLAGIVMLFAWIVSGHWKLDNNEITKVFVVLGTYWLLSCVWAIDQEGAFRSMMSFYVPSIVLLLIMGKGFQTRQDLINVSGAYLIGCIILAISCVLNRDAVIAEAVIADQERVSAFGQDKNELAFLLSMGIVVALSGILQVKNGFFLKVLLLLSILLLLYAVLLSGSRMGALILVVVMGWFVLTNKKYAVMALPIAVVLLPIIISMVPESTIERIMSLQGGIDESNLSNRDVIWEKGFSAFLKENVLLGVGYQNFTDMMLKYYGSKAASHNTYLSYLIEGGFVGIVMLFYIIYKLFRYCRRICKNTRNSYWYAYLLPIIMAMLSLEIMYRRWIFLLAIVLYKACLICRDEAQTQNVQWQR